MTNHHVRMVPRTLQISLSPPPLVLFVLLELRLEICACVVITLAGGRERGVVSGDLSCGASGGVRARGAIGGARMRRERDMVGARYRKGARLGQGAEPRGTTDRTSTHT